MAGGSRHRVRRRSGDGIRGAEQRRIDQHVDAVSTGGCIALAALVGGVPGAGLGAVAGLFIRSERWQDAPVDRLRVSVGPGPGSWFQLAISITH